MTKFKGQASIIYLLAMLFMLSVGILLADVLWNGFTTNASFISLTTATAGGPKIVASVNSSMTIFNNAIAIIFLAGCIGSIILAAFTDSSVVFAAITLILLPVEILFSLVWHDAFFTIIQNSMFAGITVVPTLMVLFTYLPVICLVIASIEILVIYIK
jgi:hypothetical protein